MQADQVHAVHARQQAGFGGDAGLANANTPALVGFDGLAAKGVRNDLMAETDTDQRLA